MLTVSNKISWSGYLEEVSKRPELSFFSNSRRLERPGLIIVTLEYVLREILLFFRLRFSCRQPHKPVILLSFVVCPLPILRKVIFSLTLMLVNIWAHLSQKVSGSRQNSRAVIRQISNCLKYLKFIIYCAAYETRSLFSLVFFFI